MSAGSESRVINVKPFISTLSKEVTATAPPMISTQLELALKITDKYQGNSYNEIIYQFRGVGKSEEEAYTRALKRFNPRDGRLKAFIQKGKDDVIEYYNTHCDLVLSKVNGLISAHKYQEAYDLLMGVPSVSRECYDKAMLKIDEFGDKLPEGKLRPKSERQNQTEEKEKIVSGRKIELLNGLFMEYTLGRYYGEDLVLKFDIINPTDEEKEIEIRGGGKNNYLINKQGEEIRMKKLEIANKSHRWGLKYKSLPDTPVEMRYFFPRERAIRQLALYLNRTVYKLNHLPIQKQQP